MLQTSVVISSYFYKIDYFTIVSTSQHFCVSLDGPSKKKIWEQARIFILNLFFKNKFGITSIGVYPSGNFEE